MEGRKGNQDCEAGPSSGSYVDDAGGFEYDVFLSFRGEDTRDDFTGFLHYALKERGIRAFMDEEDLQKGKRIETLLDAIDRSGVFVPIFSKGYADSRWCLMEVAKMVECRRLIIPVFLDVDPSDVRNQTGPFGAAFAKHKKNRKLSNETVGGWRRALSYAGAVSGYDLKTFRKKTKIIEDLVDLIQREVRDSYMVAKYPIGLDSRVANVISLLDVQAVGVRVVGICGMGGIGKTTIAKAVYNRISSQFKACSFIFDVREKWKELGGPVSMQKQLLMDLSKCKDPQIHSVEDGKRKIRKVIGNMSVLIVLDNIDDDEHQVNALAICEELLHPSSRVIITSRDEKVLRVPGVKKHQIYQLQELDEEESLQLFSFHTFGRNKPPNEFLGLSGKAASTANGIPLILEVFGSLFRDKETTEEWEAMLKMLKQNQKEEVHLRLKISYDGLDLTARRVFLDIACFFVGKGKENAIHMWEDSGFFPLIAIKTLLGRSLIKISKDKDEFIMHDQIRDMGRQIVRQEALDDPRKSSRLWGGEEILERLPYLKSTWIEGIVLNLREGSETKLSTRYFEAMSQLRLLHINFASFEGSDFGHFPANLKWLEWKECPLESLPFQNDLKNLVILNLSRSIINHVWSEPELRSSLQQIEQPFDRLKVLDLSCCAYLTTIANLTRAPHLEKLTLDECTNLEEVDESIGSLKYLAFLSMKECTSLMKLPKSIFQLSALKVLNLEGCFKLTYLGNLKSVEPDSAGSSLMAMPTSTTSYPLAPNNLPRELPDFACQLPMLEELILRDCQSLRFLPRLSFRSLKSLQIDGCQGLDSDYMKRLFEEVTFEKLENLTLSGSHSHPMDGEFSFVIPYGPLAEPLLMQQVHCHGHANQDNSEWQTISVLIYIHDMGKERLVFETKREAHCDNLDDRNSVGGCCYRVTFERNDKINGYLRCKTRMMKVKAVDGTKLKGIDIKLTKGNKFEGVPEGPTLIVTRKGTGTKEVRPLSSAPPLPASSQFEFSVLFNSREEDALEMAKHVDGLDSRADGLMELLNVQVDMDKHPTESLEAYDWSLEEILVLDLCSSNININWKGQGFGAKMERHHGEKVFEKLKVLDLSNCQTLVKTPDFTRVPSLERLVFDNCEQLNEIEGTIGHLKHLNFMSLVNCLELKELPSSIWQLNKLEALNLRGCSKLATLPEDTRDLESSKYSMLTTCNPPLVATGRMESLKDLILDNCTSLRQIPTCIGYLQSLQQLSFKISNVLEDLPPVLVPDSIAHMKKLRQLYLDNCMLDHKKLLIFMGRLEYLELTRTYDSANPVSSPRAGCYSLRRTPGVFSSRELLVSDCALSRFPDSIGNLKNLHCLSMKRCQSLKKLPNSIGRLESLREMLIEDCGVRRLPKSIGNLKSLCGLSLKQCSSLERLPNSIRKLESLQKLVLDHSSLTYLPDSIKGLKNLQHLHLTWCPSLSQLPDSMGRLQSLKELIIDHCGLIRMPGSTGDLKSLQRLTLTWCPSLSELPGSVGNLESLEELMLDHCGLVRIPESIGNLRNLSHLSLNEFYFPQETLDECELSWLPSSTGETSLEELPDSVARMKSLEMLTLDGTRIKTIPDSVAALKSLSKLSLRSCECLEELPVFIGELEMLKELLLDFTKLKKLPDSMGCLLVLEKLSFVGCQFLEELPDSIRSLPRLETLILSGCSSLQSLSYLPSSLVRLRATECTSLESILNVSNLKNLKELSTEGCEKLLNISGLEYLNSLEVLGMSGCDCLDHEFTKSLFERINFICLRRFSIPGTLINHRLHFMLPRQSLQSPLLVSYLYIYGFFITRSSSISIQIFVDRRIVLETTREAQMNEKHYVYGYGYRYEVKFEGDDDEVNKCLQDGCTAIQVSHSYVQLVRSDIQLSCFPC